MKVRLLRDARINHQAGEIVEVSPAEFGFLTSSNSAVAYKEVKAVAEAAAPKKATKKK